MTKKSRWFAGPYVAWMVLFTVIPMIIIIYYAFTDSDGGFTVQNIIALADKNRLRVFWDSLWQSLVSTLICLIIGYPVAYYVSRLSSRTQSMLITLIMVPMCMSFLLRTMAWVVLLEDNGIFYRMFTSMGFQNVKLIRTPAAVILCMVYNYLPYMILPLYTVMVKIGKPVLEAAGDLGAGKFDTFSRVVLPLSMPGVVSGITMVFVPAVSTFYISKKLGGTSMMIGDLIENYFKETPNYHMGAALSLLLMLVVLISIGIMSRAGGKETAVVV
jgi:spermidine/putrescine transport system permease protein